MAKGVFIGIDGGGTHSTAVAAYPDGRIAAVSCGGGLNFHNIGIEKAHAHMEEMCAALCRACGADATEICVGMSALDAPADDATTAAFTRGMFVPGQLDLQSDAYIALMGFTLGQPGVFVICGTGSMLLMLDKDGHQHAAGGWGYLLGDAGSGYTLAREGLLAAIDAAEGLGEDTPLLADALSYFKADAPRGLIDRIYAPDFTPDQLAGFARCVLSRAHGGDALAQEILRRNMHRLARHAAKLVEKAPEAHHVGLYGGIFAHSELARAYFTQALKDMNPAVTVSAPEYPPELGALIHLFKKRGLLTDEVLARMKSTYEEIRK